MNEKEEGIPISAVRELSMRVAGTYNGLKFNYSLDSTNEVFGRQCGMRHWPARPGKFFLFDGAFPTLFFFSVDKDFHLFQSTTSRVSALA